MCGIFGFLSTSSLSREILSGKLRKGIEALQHRGPDGQGFWINASCDVGLGHTRLAIIDIETGSQPMQSMCGRYTIVFNGEIYNYIELRKELGLGRFRTNSDTEVIIESFKKWGYDCVKKLNGMFAFAIWDELTKQVFLARDRFGIKPLYYTQRDANLIFASEIKAVRPFLESPSINSIALSDYFSTQLYLGNETLLENVFQLAPGHYATFDRSNHLEIKEYWNVSYHVDYSITENDAINHLQGLIGDSVALHLRSDVEVGGYVSGGVDSSLVSAVARFGNRNQEFKAFNGRFNDTRYDESNYARRVADDCDMKLYVTDIDDSDFINNFNKIVWHLDQPVAGPGSFPQYMVAQNVGQHLKVALGGQGGDEIFGGYARYFIMYLEQGLKAAISGKGGIDALPIAFQDFIPSLEVLHEYTPMLKNFWSSGLFDDLDRRYWKLINRADGSRSILADGVIDGDCTFERFQKHFNAANVGDESLLNSMTYFDLKVLLPGLLQVEDRMSMAHSVETRVPLLDHRILEYVATIPCSVKYSRGSLKGLLKNVAHNYLPVDVVTRRDKMGFPTPLNEWIKTSTHVREFIGDIFSSSKARNRDYLKSDFSVDQLLRMEGPYGRSLWGLLNLEVWQSQMTDGRNC